MAGEQQQYEDVFGMDWTLPAPLPITGPPLSLLSEVRTLINLEGTIARRQAAVEKAASLAEQLPDDVLDLSDNDADSRQDVDLDLRQQLMGATATIASLDTEIKNAQRFERGFVFLPELALSATSVFTEDTLPAINNPTEGALKPAGNNQNLFGWYDPFIVVGLDSRSTFGWPGTDMADRVGRARRALIGHEDWQCEREFWTGQQVPTNYHLTAGPDSPQSSPHRTLRFPFPLPSAAPTTELGQAVGLSDSLAALDQAIASADGGIGMVHATPYVVQKWSQVYPFLRDSAGNIRTVNNNLLVPGYGYPGTGPDQASRSVDDGVTTNGSPNISSATAAFTTFDLGQPVQGVGIPDGTVIINITDDTDAVMSNAATEDGVDVTLTLPGTGGDATSSQIQWAYATDMIYSCRGDILTIPADLREMSPDLPVQNLAEARAERTHSFPSNQFVRAAVLVDTTTL